MFYLCKMEHITSKVKQKKHKIVINDSITINYRLNTIKFSKSFLNNNGLDYRIHGVSFKLPESFEEHYGKIVVSFDDVDKSDYRFNRAACNRNKYVCDRIKGENEVNKVVVYSPVHIKDRMFVLNIAQIKNPIIKKENEQ